MGTWAYSYGFSTTVALAELAKFYLDKDIDAKTFRRRFKQKDFFDTLNKETPGSSWNGNFYRDVQSDVEKKNHILVYQDTYIFGRGYLHMTDIKVPEKYFHIK